MKITLSLNMSSIFCGTSFSLKWTCFTFINKCKLELKVVKYQIFVRVLVMLGRVMLNIRDAIFLFFNVNQHVPKSYWFTETKRILSVTAFAFFYIVMKRKTDISFCIWLQAEWLRILTCGFSCVNVSWRKREKCLWVVSVIVMFGSSWKSGFLAMGLDVQLYSATTQPIYHTYQM